MDYGAMIGTVDPDLTSACVEDISQPFLEVAPTENSVSDEYDIGFSSAYETTESEYPVEDLMATTTIKVETGTIWSGLAADQFWACDSCNEEFPNYESLVLHVTGNLCSEISLDTANGVEFMEQSCDPAFLDETPLVLYPSYEEVSAKYPHFNLKSPRLRLPRLDTYICSTCEQIFLDKTIYKQHISTEHGDVATQNSNASARPSVYKCSYCPQKFNNTNYLKMHERKCAFGNECLFECWVCSAGFQSQEEMKNHIRTHFTCTSCPASFLQQSHLIKHSAAHIGPTPFQCHAEGCGERFRTTEHLHTHHQLIHPEEQLHWVSSQERSANLESEIPIVECSITGDGDEPIRSKCAYSCKSCTATFEYRAEYTRHCMNVTTERFQCSICMRKFCSKYALQRHTVVVHDEKCEETNKDKGVVPAVGSLNKEWLNVPPRNKKAKAKRKSSGSSTIKHKCPECPQTFTTKFSVTRHMSVHTGVNMYSCLTCSESFKSKLQQERHYIKFPLHSCPGESTPTSSTWEDPNIVQSMTTTSTLEDPLVVESTKTTASTWEDPVILKVESTTTTSTWEDPVILEIESSTTTTSAWEDPVKVESTTTTMTTGTWEDPVILEVENTTTTSTREDPGISESTSSCSTSTDINADPENFQCSLCSKTCTSKFSLNRHMSVHTGVNMYPCLTCPESFKTKVKRNQHYNDFPLHKQIDCPICCYPFVSQEELDHHRKTNACIVVEPPLITLD